MTTGELFVAIIILLEYGAGVCYGWNGDWRRLIIWVCWATATVAVTW